MSTIDFSFLLTSGNCIMWQIGGISASRFLYYPDEQLLNLLVDPSELQWQTNDTSY